MKWFEDISSEYKYGLIGTLSFHMILLVVFLILQAPNPSQPVIEENEILLEFASAEEDMGEFTQLSKLSEEEFEEMMSEDRNRLNFKELMAQYDARSNCCQDGQLLFAFLGFR